MTTQANMDLRLLLLILIVAATSAGPIASNQRRCATTCSENAKFHYEPGKTYEYLYTADTTSKMNGADSDLAGMHIRATAKVEVIAPCDMTLKLTDITLEESDSSARRRSESSDDLSRHLSARPVHFSYQDGRVVALCAEEEDPEWVLNIKRGVLSAFQNSMDHFNADHVVSEVDVAGRCDAAYSISRGFTSTTITKSKDLLACMDRVDPMSAFKAMPYQTDSKLQSLPIVKSRHTCEQSVSSGLLARSECRESHVLRPFSNDDSGAMTETRHSLELQSQSTGVSSDRVGTTRQTDLLFKHDDELESSQDASLAEATLRQACDSEDIRPETPALFSQLISQLRSLDETTLRRLRKTVENERICSANHHVAKKFVRDALPMTGTSASVSVMTRAVAKGQVEGRDADAWMSSLAFVPEPKLTMVRSVHRLLSMENPSRASMLASSSLVHAFCLSRDCEAHTDVTEIAQILAAKLGQSCQHTSPEEREQILSVLKSLGNMGVSTGVSSILARCASNIALDAEVRVAALDAYRRMPCHADDRADPMTVFTDVTEDSEVRIAAYVSAMRCPTESRLRQVRRALATEEVNQVGSFIWTHLTNLQETQDQFKSSLRAILGDARLQREFNLDARKFSRNYDASYFSDTFNTGAKVDGNLVWSQSSFVPRSANLNLTVDVFGNSVNLLEVGGRVEGAEALLESIFGPEGYFPDTAISDALTRAKRSVSDDPMEAIRSQFAGPSTSGPSGSLYLRMFGNELAHASVSGDSLDSLRDSFNPLELMLTLAQGGSMDLGKHVQFVDSTLTLPTLLGMPLRLALNGTASVALQVGGKMDLRQVAANPREIDIDGYVKPSGAIELTSTMTMDATLMKTGLKMTSTLHTSTQANVLLKMQNGQVIQAKVDMPREKIEIASLKSRVYLISGEQEREQQLITEGRVEKEICTGSQLETVAGLRLCASLAYPNATLQESAPWYPLTGPLTAEIALEKVDDFSAYEFEASFIRDQERSGPLNRLSGRVGFNTPGSRVDRELLVDFNLDVPQKTVTAELRSPWKRATLNGILANQEDLKRASLTVLVDGTHEAALDAQLHRQVLSRGVTYTPNVELRWPGREAMTLEGVFTHKPSELTSAELTINNVFETPIVIKGTFSQDLQDRTARIDNLFEVRTPYTDIKGSAYVEMNAGTTRGEADLVYLVGGQKERMSASMRLKRVNNRRTYRKMLACEVSSTQFPQYNARLDADFKNIEGQADTSVDFRYGNDLETTKQRLTFTHTMTYGQENDQFTMDHSARLSCKPLALAMDGKLNHMHSPSEVRTRGVLNYMQGQQANLDLTLTRSSDPIGLSADVTLSYPGRVLHLTDLFETRGPQQYHHELMVQWAEDARITTSTDVGKTNNRYELRSDLQVPGLRPVVLTAGITPDPMALDAMTSLQFQDNTYSGSMAYNYRHREQLTWTLDLLHPARHVTSQGDLQKTSSALTTSMDFLWDADRDTSRKVSVDASIHRLEAGFSSQGKLQYPGRKITMAADHERSGDQYTSNGQISWATGQRVTVHHEMTMTKTGRHNMDLVSNWHMTTPFTGIESLEGQLQYNGQSSENNLQGSFQWAEGQRVEATLQHARPGGWMRVQNQLTIRTPFTTVQIMDVRLNYNMLRDVPRANLDIDFNGEKVVDIDMAGKMAQSDGQFDMTVRTPMGMARNVRVMGEYGQSGNQLNGHAFINFNGQRFEATYEGQNTQGQLVIKNPYTDDVTISGSHTLENGQYTTTSSVQWAADRQITGSVQVSLSKPSSHGEIMLTTPFTKLGQVKLEWNHAIQNTNFQADTTFVLNEDTFKMTVNHVHETSGNGYSVTTDLTVESPCEILSSGAIHVQSSMADSDVVAVFTVSRNGEQCLSVNGGLKLDITDINANVRVIVSGGAPIALSAVIKPASMPYQGHLEASWDHTQRVAMDGELSYSGFNELRGRLQLETPVLGYERMHVTLNHNMNSRAYTTNAQLQYASDKQIQIEVTGQPEEKRMSLQLTTPCPRLRRFALSTEPNTMTIEHECEDGRTNLVMSKNTDGSTYNIRITSPYQYLENINMDATSQVENGDKVYGLAIDLSQTKKIEGTIRIATNGSPRFSAELTTPFAVMSSFRAGFNHHGTSTVFSNEMSMNLVSEVMPVEFTTALEVNGLSSITGSTRITGPYTAQLDIEHEVVPRQQMNSKFEMSFGEDKYGTTLSLNRNQRRGTWRLYTPHSEFEELTIELEKGTNYRNAYKLIANGQTHTTEFTVGYNGMESLSFAVDMSSPIIPENRAQASISNAITASGMETQLSAMCASHTYTIESEVNYHDNRITITMNTPVSGYERLHLNAYYDPSEYHSHAQIQYPGSQISGDIRLTTSPVKLTISVASPFEAMRTLEFSFEHTGDIASFSTIAELDYNQFDGKVKTEIAFNKQGANIEADFKFNSPFSSAERFNLHMDNKLQGSRYVTSFMGQYLNDYTLQLTSEMNLNSLEDFNGHMDIASTFGPIRALAVATSHTGGMPQGSSEFELTVDHTDKYKVSTTWNLASSVEISARIETPIMEALTFNLRHQGEMHDFTNAMEIALGQQVTDLHSSFTMSGGVEASLHFTTPFLDDFDFRIRHQGDWLNFQHSSQLSYIENEQIRLTGSSSTSDGLVATMSLDTPYPEMRHAEVSMTHTGNMYSFENDAHITVDSLRLESTATWSMQSNSMYGNIALKSSLSGYESFGLEFQNSWESSYQSTITAKYGNNQMVVDGSLDMQSGLRTQLSIRGAPFMENTVFSLQHTGEATHFENEMHIRYADTEVVSYTGSFQLQTNQVTGNFEVTTSLQGLEKLELQFNHAAGEEYTSHTTLTYGNDQMTITGSLVSQPNVVFDIDISPPTWLMPKLEFTLQCKPQLADFSLQSKFLQDDVEMYTIASTFTMEPVRGSLRLTSPHATMRSFEIAFSHSTSRSEIQQTLIIKHNAGEIFKLDSTINSPTSDATFRITTMGHSVSINAGHSGQLQSFRQFLRIDYDSQSIWSYSGTYGIGDSYDMDVEILTPNSALPHLTIKGSHQGPISNFHQELEVKLNGESALNYRNEFTFGNNIHGTISFGTFFDILSNVQLTFNHAGGYSHFNNDMSLHYNDEELISYRGTFSRTSDSLAMDMNMGGIYQPVSQFSVQITCTGSMENLQASFEMNLDDTSLIHVSFNGPVIPSPNMNINIRGNSNKFGIASASLTITHKTTGNKFEDQLRVTMNEFMLSLSSTIDLESSPSIAMEMSSSMEQLSSLSLAVNTRFEANQQELSIRYNGMSVFTFNNDMNTANGININMEMTTSYEPISLVKVTFVHNGELTNFNDQIKVQVNYFKLTFSSGIDVGLITNIRAELTTTLGQLPHISMNLHLEKLNQEISIQYDSNSVFTLSNTIQNQNGITINMDMTSAYEPIASVKIVYSSNGQFTNFNQQLQIQVNEFRLTFSNDIEVGQTTNIRAEMTSTLQQLQELSVDMQLQVLNQEINIHHNRVPVFTLTNSFNSDHGITINMDMTSAYEPISHLKITFNHNGAQLHFNDQLQIQVNEVRLTLSSDIEVGQTTNIRAEMTSTLEQLQELSVNMQLQLLNQEINIHHNRVPVFTLTNSFNSENGITINMDMTSAYEPISHLKIVFNHNGAQLHFNDELQMQVNDFRFTFSSNIDVQNTPTIRAELSSSEEQLSQLSINLRFQANQQELTIRHNDMSVFTFTNNFSLQNGLSVNSDITSVYSPMSHVTMAFNHQGGPLNFRNDFKIVVNGNDFVHVTSNAELSMQYNIAAEMKTWYNELSQASVSAKHINGLHELEMKWNEQSVFKYSMELDMNDGFSATMSVTSAYEPLTSLVIIASHRQTGISFHNEGSIQLNGERLVSTSSTMENTNFQASVQTSYQVLSQAAVKASYVNNQIRFEIEYNDDDIFTFQGRCNVENGFNLRLDFSSQYELLSHMTVEVTHIGGIFSFTNEGSIHLNGQQLVSLTSGVDNTRMEINLSTASALISQLSLKVEYARSQQKIEFKYNNEAVFTYTGTIHFNNGITVEFDVTTVYEPVSHLSLTLSHNGGITHFNNAVTFNLNDDQIFSMTSLLNGARFEAELHTIFSLVSQMSVKTSYANRQHAFEIKYNDESLFTYNGNYQFRNGFHLAMDITTPYQLISQLSISVSHTGGLANFNSEGSIGLNGQRLVSVTSTLDTTSEYSFEVELLTRFESVAQASVKINCVSGRQEFETKFNNEVLFTYSGDCDFSNGFQLDFTLNTQFEPISQLRFNGRHSGGLLNFNNEGSISLNGERVVAVSNNVNMDSEYHIESELSTAGGVSSVSVFMRRSAHGPEFGMNVNGETVFTIGGSYDLDNGMHANLHLTTMLSAVSDLRVTLSHNGNYLTFTNEASIQLNGERLFSLGSQVDLSPDISLTVELRTSCSAVSQLSVGLKYQGDFISNSQEFELKHNDISVLKVNNNFSTQRGLRGELHITTASQVLSDLVLSYHQVVSLSSFTNNGFIQLNGNRIFTLSTEISATDSYNINVEMSTASELLSQLSLTADYESGATTRQSVEFNLNGQRMIQYTLGFTFDHGVTVDLSMSTAHSSLSSLVIHLQHRGALTNFNCNGNVELNGANLISGTCAFSMASGVSARMSIDSVYDILRDIDISLSHNGNLQSFTVRGTASQAGKEVALDVTHRGNPFKFTNSFEMSMNSERVFKMENDVDIQTRFYIESRMSTVITSMSDILFKLEHTGTPSNVHTVGELSVNGNKIISVDAEITATPLSGRISLDSICPYLQDVEFSLNHNDGILATLNMDGRSMEIRTHHDGTWDNFRHSLHITLDNEAVITYNGELKLSGPFKVHIQYESTCSVFQSLEFLFEHNGPLEEFRNNLVIKFNDMNVLSATSQFSATSAISGSLSTESDFGKLNNIRIAVSHEGSIREFTSSIELRKDHASYDMSLEVNIQNFNDFRVTLRTPFEHAQELTLAASHHSTSNGLTTQLEVSTDGTTYNGAFEYSIQLGPEMSGTFRLSGPFEVVRSMEFTYNMHIRDNALRMGSEFKSNYLGEYGMNVAFSSESDFSGSANIKTPFRYFTDNTFEFQFNGDMRNMRSQMTMSIEDLVDVAVDASLVYNNGIQGQLEVRSNIEGMRHLALTLNHEGSLFNFNTELNFNHNGDQIAHIAANVQTASGIVAQLTMQSVRAELRNLRIKLTHNGEITDFSTGFEISYNGNEMLNAAVTFRARPGIEGSFVLSLPTQSFNNLEIRFTHEGSLMRFRTASSLVINHEQQGEANMEFDVTDGIVLSLSISTPLSEPITLHLSHQGTILDFTTETRVQVSNQALSARAHFTQSPLNLDVQISTPFPSTRNLGVTLQHQGSISEFNTAVNVVHNDAAYESQIAFTASPTADVTLRINTPFTGVQEASLRLRHQGNMENFQTGLTLTYGNGQTVEGRITFSVAPEFVARVEIQAPSVRASSGIRYTTSGHERHVTLDATWNEMACQLSGTIKSRPFEITVQLTTPFQHVRDLYFSSSMRRGRKSFHAEFELRHNHEPIVRFVSDLNNYAETSGTLTLQTPIPYVEHIGATFTARSDDRGLQYEASVTAAPGKSIGANIRVQRHPTPQLELTMNTPFTGYERINGQVSLFKNDNDAGLDVEISMSTGNIYSMQMRLSQDPTLQGSIIVRTPFTEEFNHRFNGEITGSTLILTTETHYGTARGSLRFTLQATPHVEGQLQIETPFEGLERIEFSFLNENLESAFRKAITLTLAPGISYEFAMESSFGQDKSFAINVKTPYTVMRDVVIRGTFQKSDSRMAYTFDMTNEELIILSHHLTLHMSPHKEISATLRTPISSLEFTSLTAKLEQTETSIAAESEFTYNGGRHVTLNYLLENSGTSIHSTFDLSTPCTYLTDFGFSLNLDTASRTQSPHFVLRYQHNDVISANAEVNLPTRLLITVNTPVTGYETVRLTINNNENGNRYEPSVVLSWGDQEVELTGALVKSGSRYNTQLEGTLELRTPWSLLREVRMQAGQTRGRGGLTTRLSSSYNQQSILDLEVQTSQEGSHRAANVAIRSPMEVSGRTSMDGNLQQFTADIEVTVDGQSVSLEVSRNSHDTGHSISTRLTTPTRTMQLASNCEWTTTSWTHTTDFTWDLARARTVRHVISLEARTSSSLQHYSIQTRLDTPLRALELSASTEKTATALTTSATVFWDAAGDRTRTISVTNRVEKTRTSYVQEVTLSLPGAERDINLRNELGINSAGKVFSGRTEVQYSNDPSRHFTVSASLEDSTTDGLNYTLQFGLSHPASQIDMQLVSNFADNPSSMAAGLEMNYLSAGARQRSNMRLRGEIQKLRSAINMEMSSPINNFRMNGNYNELRDRMSMRMVAGTDDSHQVSASLDLNSADRTLDMKAYLDPENVNSLVHVIGKYTPTSLALDAYHQDGESHVSDAEIDVEVRDKRLVYSKLFWRPQILADIKESLIAKAQEFKSSLVNALAATNDAITTEMSSRETLIPELPDVAALFEADARDFSSDWAIIMRELETMYNNNEFYMQDIERFSMSVYSVISTAVAEVTQHIVSHIRSTYAFFVDVLNTTKTLVQNTLAELSRNCVEVCAELLRSYQAAVVQVNARWQAVKLAALDRAATFCHEVAVVAGPVVSDLYNYTATYANEAYDFISSHPYVREAAARVSQIDLWAPATDVHLALSQHIHNLTEGMQSVTEGIVETYVNTVRYVTSTVVNHVRAFVMQPEVRYVLNFVKNTTDQVRTLYDGLQFQDTSRQALEDFLTSVTTIVRTNAQHLLQDWLQLDQDRIINWAPAEGLIEFQVYIPMDLPDIQPVSIKVPDFRRLYSVWVERLYNLLPSFDIALLWDLYYQYKPSTDVANWVPPFKSFAVIGARQHYMTFDRRYYDFASPCSHVLAGDHVTGQWSLSTAPTEDDVNARTLAFVAGTDRIEITPEYQVLVNGVVSQLPVFLTGASVLRNGNMLSIATTNGVSFLCDVTHDICRLEVPGWQFGKTGGLLGTYNNEPVDDLSAPNGQRMTSLTDFTSSWSLGGNCRSNAVEPVAGKPEAACQELFNNTRSPFRSCYTLVDPTPFLKMCGNDSVSSHAHGSECHVAAMYVHACRKDGVHLHMPRPCVRCDDTMEAGDVAGLTDVTSAVRSADVVFVVEESECNQDMLTHVRNIAIKMETMALRSIGLKNNQFGLIGFGGADVHSGPHSHTINGTLMGSARSLRRALPSMSFTATETSSDVSPALQLATTYPWRAGTSKTLILTTCDVSSSNDDVQRVLRDLGVTVHVLRTHEFDVTTDTPRTSRLFGTDANTAFTSDHVSDEELVGDIELFQQIAPPSDSLSQLAHSSGGTLFDVSHLNTGRVAVQKRFIDVFVRRVAKSATPPSCQACTCEVKDVTATQTVCRPCTRA